MLIILQKPHLSIKTFSEMYIIKPMKVYIEGSAMFGEKTGVGQYCKGLVGAMIKLDRKNHYSIFGLLWMLKKFSPPIRQQPNLTYRLIRYLPSKVYSKLIKSRLAPPIDLLLGFPADLYFYPNFVSFPLLRGKSVVVIHDLSFIKYPQFVQGANRKYLSRFVPQSIEKAAHIITISKNSKAEICEYYKVPEEKIAVVYPAADLNFFFPRDESEILNVRDKYGIDRKYILYTGTIEPRKNIVGILDAYSQLEPKLRDEYQLVLGGGMGWLAEEINSKLKDLKKLNIKATGYIDDEDLPALYSGASLFVFPSHYEGFGMPPLEAMACGVPVITSNVSSLPEVVGGAGILVGPNDTNELVESMEKLLKDPALRCKFKERGLKQAAKFTWEESASKLIKVFEKVAS